MKSYQKSTAKRAARWLPVALLSANFSLACGSGADHASASSQSTKGKQESADAPTSQHGGHARTSGGRVVGYISTWRLHGSPALDFSTLTHLNLSFANVMGDGSIDFPEQDRGVIPGIVARAKQGGVKVLAAIGGGTGNAGTELPKDVPGFVEKLLALIAKYDLDGVDIDIEGAQIHAVAYPKLIELLSQQLPKEQVLSVAVAEDNKQNYGPLDKADFLNVMSYDKCGSWDGGRKCEHSTYEDAKGHLAYWSTQTTPDRVVLGMPFYARCWGTACDTSKACVDGTGTCSNVVDYSYADFLSSKFASSATCQPDLLEGEGYYVSLNGPATLASKVALGGNYGGVMIWELGQDTRDGYAFSIVRDALNGVEPHCDTPPSSSGGQSDARRVDNAPSDHASTDSTNASTNKPSMDGAPSDDVPTQAAPVSDGSSDDGSSDDDSSDYDSSDYDSSDDDSWD